MLFFREESVWVKWFKEVILKGSIHNYWTTTPKQSYSWLANKLLKLRDTIFPLIKLRLQNGNAARFWFDNWTPFGRLYDYLSASTNRLGIPLNATVSSLSRNGLWQLPPARSENQLQLHCHLTIVQLTTEEDYYEWELDGKRSTKFETGKLYTYLCEERMDVQWHRPIWTSRGIPRHNLHSGLWYKIDFLHATD